jgi:adenosylhomocysteine nucleosidase
VKNATVITKRGSEDVPCLKRIAIFAALQWECRPVLHRLRGVTREPYAGATVWRGTTAACEVWLVKTGMGLARAATAARALRDASRFDLVISTGCAGALAPDLRPGDLAVASTIIGNDGERFETDATQREQLCRAAERAALRSTVGPVLCSKQVLATIAEKRSAAACGAMAVEMEGAPIAAGAAQAGVAFVSVRAILDTADTELPHMGKVVDPQNGAVKPLALAGYLATHPGALPALLALQEMRRVAEASLEQFFAAWLGKWGLPQSAWVDEKH